MQKRILKYLALTVVATVAINAHAVNPGLYMGFMFGPSTNDADSLQAMTAPGSGAPAFVNADPKGQQFGSSIYLGYKFNRWAAFEGGLYYFTGIGYDTHGFDTCSGTNQRVRSIYFDGKVDYTFWDTFGVFGKAGVAVTYLATSGAFNPPTCQNVYNNKFTPTFSVGISYDINQSWVADLSANRILVGSFINNVTFYGIGLSYHFVDRYCGQFLCDD